jgi:dGTPase
MGRSLRLNEDLIEAIALGHNLGATPFGDAGDEGLSLVTPGPFRAEEQSLRVVEVLENDGAGLNLTWEVRDGIVNHRADMPAPATLEGQSVRIADAIVSATCDLRDARRVGLLTTEVPDEVTACLGEADDERQAALVRDVVTQSMDEPELAMSPRVEQAHHRLLDILRTALQSSVEVIGERNRAVHCVSSLAVYLLQHPPADAATDADAVTAMCDAVAGLTDSQALAEYRRRFLPGT